MPETEVLLPGDSIETASIPTAQKRRLGVGIKQFANTNDYVATTAAAGDLVIGQVRGSSQDFFHLIINPYSAQAILPHLAFEGASKKTRPQLKTNDIVYAKVVSAHKNMEVELSCVNPSTGKAQPEGLGPLSGGTVFDISQGFAERLTKKQGVGLMDVLGSKIPGGFEVVIGRNGRVWVDCPEAGVRGIMAVGHCLKEADRRCLTEKEQEKMAKKVVSDAGAG